MYFLHEKKTETDASKTCVGWPSYPLILFSTSISSRNYDCCIDVLRNYTERPSYTVGFQEISERIVRSSSEPCSERNEMAMSERPSATRSTHTFSVPPFLILSPLVHHLPSTTKCKPPRERVMPLPTLTASFSSLISNFLDNGNQSLRPWVGTK